MIQGDPVRFKTPYLSHVTIKLACESHSASTLETNKGLSKKALKLEVMNQEIHKSYYQKNYAQNEINKMFQLDETAKVFFDKMHIKPAEPPQKGIIKGILNFVKKFKNI